MPINSRHQHQCQAGQKSVPIPCRGRNSDRRRIRPTFVSHCRGKRADQPDGQSECGGRSKPGARRDKRPVGEIWWHKRHGALMVETQPVTAQRRMIGVVTVLSPECLDRNTGDQVVPSQLPGLLNQVHPLLDVKNLIDSQPRSFRQRRITSRRIHTDRDRQPCRERHQGRRPGCQDKSTRGLKEDRHNKRWYHAAP